MSCHRDWRETDTNHFTPTGHSTGRLNRHFVPNEVYALDPDFHHCTWKCHCDFDHNNCITLCGDNCVHLNCNNHCCPDLFPPPASYPSTSVSASLPFQCPKSSSIIVTPKPFCPLDGAYLEFVILCLNLNGYVAELQRDHRNRHTTLNRHEHWQIHVDDWPNPVWPWPLSRHGIPTRSPCSTFLAMMGRGSMGLRGREEGQQSGTSTAVSSSDEGQPLWVPPLKFPWHHSWISTSCPSCYYSFQLHWQWHQPSWQQSHYLYSSRISLYDKNLSKRPFLLEWATGIGLWRHGLSFPVASYHNTLQILVHNQGY